MEDEGRGVTLDLGKLPNLRRLIVPDPGMTIIDVDLQRADLYVVAADARCEKLMHRLRTEDVHTRHAIEFLGKSGKWERDTMKKLAHAGDYLVGVRTASAQTGLPEAKIYDFLRYWYTTYPEIGSVDRADPNPNCWHERVKARLKSRVITNAFGYRRPFYDRLDNCLPEAVAWIPQSTVAIVINIILDRIIERLPDIIPLLQVHDSLTLQAPTGLVPILIPQIERLSKVSIPYDPPLIIPVSFKTSEKSWGDVVDYVEAANPLNPKINGSER